MNFDALPESVRLLVLQNVQTPNILTSSVLPPFDFSVSARAGEAGPLLSVDVLNELHDQGAVKIDGLAGSELAQGVLEEMKALRNSGAMKQAGMQESGAGKWSDKTVRGDLHMWLGENTGAQWPFLGRLLDRLDAVAAELRRVFPSQSLDGRQAQATCYPGNQTGYARHIDASADSAPSRVLTLVW